MNLLTDPLLSVDTSTGPADYNLPQLLAGLGNDEVTGLPGLQRHQADPFHVFMCYLAAAVLIKEGVDSPSQNEEFWRTGIRRLTGRDDDLAWTLVVDDPTQPGFMQPPLPTAADKKKLKIKAITPDELDLLPTSKNHDLKSTRQLSANPEQWIYSLLSLQTMSGFFGRGNYGIARMNGGFASRPFVSLIYPGPFGQRWRRDLTKLVTLYPTLIAARWPYDRNGIVLTWTEQWSGENSLPLTSLSPYFIEVARIVRLIERNEGIQAFAMPSEAPRIAAKDQRGVLGDPWIPISKQKKEITALTVSPAGLTPKLLSNLLLEDGFEAAAMQQPDPDKKTELALFYASVMVRGQGTTDGFHSIRLPIPGHAMLSLFGGTTERDKLAKTSKTGLNDAQTMQNKVLKPALFSLLEGGPEKLDFGKTEVGAWVDQAAKRFSASWSTDYFDWLWRTLDEPDADRARLSWLRSLEQKAQTVLEESLARLPEHRSRHYRGRVNAQGMFFGSLYKNFPELKEKKDATPAN